MNMMADTMTRMRLASDHLKESLRSIIPMDDDTVNRVATYYLKHKLARLDPHLGRSSVKHGLLLSENAVAAAIILVESQKLDP